MMGKQWISAEWSMVSLPTKFELNPNSCLSINGRKLLEESDAWKQREFSEALLKVNQARGRPIMTLLTKFELNLLANCSPNQRPGHSGSSVKHDQKLIRTWGRTLMNLLTKFQFNLIGDCVWICEETAKWIRGQDRTRIQWSVTKS